MKHTQLINVLVVTALLSSASQVDALARQSASTKRTAIRKAAAAKKGAAADNKQPSRMQRMKNWFGREIFNRKKLGRNAKYVGGATATAALIAALVLLVNRMRAAAGSNSTNDSFVDCGKQPHTTTPRSVASPNVNGTEGSFLGDEPQTPPATPQRTPSSVLPSSPPQMSMESDQKQYGTLGVRNEIPRGAEEL
ncbi:MAG: hypothetical protein PVJ92_02950 [Candidatus Dependentiae bacterium]|jgi:hypothetical protein